MMRFYVGLHHPCDARHVPRCMVSVNAIRRRRSDFAVNEWIMDSGAFSELARHGGYRHTVEEYAAQVRRWSTVGRMVAAVAQDWMCEPFIVAITGLSVAEHQRLTIERYDRLRELTADLPIMPVLQGYQPHEYAAHVRAYGDRLPRHAWVGVGSVCKRNGNPDAIAAVLLAIRHERPDLRLHGFGIKLTALSDPRVRALLWSADSMAWSFAARRQGRDANDYHEAIAYSQEVEIAWNGPRQPALRMG